jgi:hypothetical protein
MFSYSGRPPHVARRWGRIGAMDLTVRVTGRDGEDHIPVPDGTTPRDELARFLNRQGPYAQMWIRLASGEYVRYEHILSVAQPPDDV